MADNLTTDVNLASSSTIPASADKKAVTVRADPQQHKAWTAAAAAQNRSLANWLSYLADKEVGIVKPDVKPDETSAKPPSKRKAR